MAQEKDQLMKKLLFVTALLFSMNSFAAVSFEGSTNGNLDMVESMKVKELLLDLVEKEYEGSYLSVSVKYNCTSTPLMKVFCSTTITNEGGTLGAAVVTYDRNSEKVILIEHIRAN